MTRIRTEGAQFMERRENGAAPTPVHQFVRTEIRDDRVWIEVRGIESGQSLWVPGDDPAIVEHYLQRDYAEFVVSLSERPAVAEPSRIPEPGRGVRTCVMCGGRGGDETVEGWLDCLDCNGCGVIPNDDGSGARSR